ncbi:hypothetical protein ES703_30273 [subsurface metagenome]
MGRKVRISAGPGGREYEDLKGVPFTGREAEVIGELRDQYEQLTGYVVQVGETTLFLELEEVEEIEVQRPSV